MLHRCCDTKGHYINIHLKKLTWQVGMQDLLKEFQFLFRFHISWTKHISLRPHLPEHDKKMVNTSITKREWLVWGVDGVLSLADLAARSSPSASGPSRARRASCTRTMASVRCSSSGVSDVASNGTMLSVKDSDNCTRKTERLYSVLANVALYCASSLKPNALVQVDSHTDLTSWSLHLFLHNLPGLCQGLWTSFYSWGLFSTFGLSPLHPLLLQS